MTTEKNNDHASVTSAIPSPQTSRQRVLAAINHQEPARVPVDLGSNPSSGISAIAYHHVCQKLGFTDAKTRVYDVVQQLALPDERFLHHFGIDVMDTACLFNTEDKDWYNVELTGGIPAQYPAWFHPTALPDGSWEARNEQGAAIGKMPRQGTFFDQCFFPYVDGYPDNYKELPKAMNNVIWAALVHGPWDHAQEPDFWEQLRLRAHALRQRSTRALMLVCGCNLFEWGTFLRRMDNFLMDVFADQSNVERLLDALMEVHLDTLNKVIDAVGDNADIIRFGDDLGMDCGPFMSPDIYRKLFKPRHAQLCRVVKQRTHWKIFLHSCGSIFKLMPDLIEAGYDILNPVQTNCNDMDPVNLKKTFGRDITFWGGGCDTRHVLNRATPQQVKDHVKERVAIFAPGGGFVFNPIHNILPDVPPENVIAVFDALNEINA